MPFRGEPNGIPNERSCIFPFAFRRVGFPAEAGDPQWAGGTGGPAGGGREGGGSAHIIPPGPLPHIERPRKTLRKSIGKRYLNQVLRHTVYREAAVAGPPFEPRRPTRLRVASPRGGAARNAAAFALAPGPACDWML